MAESITCQTGHAGLVRGMKVREERILSDRKLEKNGGQVDEERARYGEGLLAGLAEDLTNLHGRGFTERNLRNFRTLFLAFPIRQSLPAELTWTHLRVFCRRSVSPYRLRRVGHLALPV